MLPGRGTCPYLGRPDKGGLSVLTFSSMLIDLYSSTQLILELLSNAMFVHCLGYSYF